MFLLSTDPRRGVFEAEALAHPPARCGLHAVPLHCGPTLAPTHHAQPPLHLDLEADENSDRLKMERASGKEIAGDEFKNDTGMIEESGMAVDDGSDECLGVKRSHSVPTKSPRLTRKAHEANNTSGNKRLQRVHFSQEKFEVPTYPSEDYERGIYVRPRSATELQTIKRELMAFKREMDIHPDSRQNTSLVSTSIPRRNSVR